MTSETIRFNIIVQRNNEIAALAKRKELTAAMKLFNQAVTEGLANSHTFAAAINANIRCGSISGAEDVMLAMKKAGRKCDVIIYTTIMKGYCSSNQLAKALDLLNTMSRSPNSQPNIRTINTILRGCVQEGAIKEGEQLINQASKHFKIALDVNSWEYLIALLSQALKIDKALPIIGRLKADPSMSIGIAKMYFHVARAAALLGDWKTSLKLLLVSQQTTSELIPNEGGVEVSRKDHQSSSIAKGVEGGKRGWKRGTGSNNSNGTFCDHNDYNDDGRAMIQPSFDAREESLALYRDHSKMELDADCKALGDFIDRMRESNKREFLEVVLSHCARVVSLIQPSNAAAMQNTPELILSLTYEKFGIYELQKRINALRNVNEENTVASLNISSPFDSAVDAVLNFSKLFTRFKTDNLHVAQSRKVKMEICSGAGEWIVAQAKNDPESDWVALELRHDRAYQTLCRAVIQGVPQNLGVLCGDAMHILPTHVAAESVHELFVNYPEPPQQAGGADSEGKHLLTKNFFLSAQRIMKPGGRFTILTDNEWYGNYLLKLIAELSRKRSDENDNFNLKSVAAPFKTKRNGATGDASWTLLAEDSGVRLYKGQPGAPAGHMVEASSYFDRLWKRSQITDRFFFVMEKPIQKRKKSFIEDGDDVAVHSDLSGGIIDSNVPMQSSEICTNDAQSLANIIKEIGGCEKAKKRHKKTKKIEN